jgi:hypothetical protein
MEIIVLIKRKQQRLINLNVNWAMVSKLKINV